MNYKSYTETFEGEHQYHMVFTCTECKKDEKITLKASDLFRYNRGAFVQNAFPYLTVEQREMIITNICGDCFKKLFDFHYNGGSCRKLHLYGGTTGGQA